MTFSRYTFRQSKIWEAGNPIDENRDPITISAKSEGRARRKLPDIGLGRVWILTDVKEKVQTS